MTIRLAPAQAAQAHCGQPFAHLAASASLGMVLVLGAAVIAPASASLAGHQGSSNSKSDIAIELPQAPEQLIVEREAAPPAPEIDIALPQAPPLSEAFAAPSEGGASPLVAAAQEAGVVLSSTSIASAIGDALEAEADSASRNPDEVLLFEGRRVPRLIVETILRASEVTGVDPVYMMALADKESSFIATNRASTSSAEGLFQFIAGTWLEAIRSFGAQHGLVEEAAAIEGPQGQLSIPDEAMRQHVLNLRRDPYISAIMAAEMLKRDRAEIERRVGRRISRSEYYLAHFFGVDSASKFIALVDDRPRQSAPRLFPAAARANRALFFAKSGRKTRHLTVAEVYDKLDEMIDTRLGRYQGVMQIALTEADL